MVRTIAALLLVAASGWVSGCVSGGVSRLRETPGYVLTVMSFNIQYGGGGTNLSAIADAIRTQDADIVALQEVDVRWSARSDFADQAAALASELGMQVRFAPIYSIAGADADSGNARATRQFGVALLSRYAITKFANMPLTRLSTQDTTLGPQPMPGLLEATIDILGTEVRVFNTHLDYRADARVRRMQVAELLDYIGTSPGPIIVFGDMNARPDAPELQPLLARFRDTWDRREGTGFTMPAMNPDRRIDYVLVSDDISVTRAHVPAITASDHRPVVVDIIVPVSGR